MDLHVLEERYIKLLESCMNEKQYTAYNKHLHCMLTNPEKYGYLEEPKDKMTIAEHFLKK